MQDEIKLVYAFTAFSYKKKKSIDLINNNIECQLSEAHMWLLDFELKEYSVDVGRKQYHPYSFLQCF